MKVSTKGRYGLRFLMDVAMHQGTGNVTLRDVSARQEISEKYLWQVVTPLKKEGVIRAVAGPHGGYALAKAAGTITLQEVLGALEGTESLVECTEQPDGCARSNACAARQVWREVDQKIAQVLKGITLNDVIEKQQTMTADAASSYAI